MEKGKSSIIIMRLLSLGVDIFQVSGPGRDVIMPVGEGEREPSPSNWIHKSTDQMSAADRALIGEVEIRVEHIRQALRDKLEVCSQERINDSLDWGDLFPYSTAGHEDLNHDSDGEWE